MRHAIASFHPRADTALTHTAQTQGTQLHAMDASTTPSYSAAGTHTGRGSSPGVQAGESPGGGQGAGGVEGEDDDDMMQFTPVAPTTRPGAGGGGWGQEGH